MPVSPSNETYSLREIAQAAGVPVERVSAALGRPPGARVFVGHADAVRVGRALAARDSTRMSQPVDTSAAAPRPVDAPGAAQAPLFSIFAASSSPQRSRGVPLAVSSTLHAGIVVVAVLVTTFAPTAATLATDNVQPEDLRLVFIATPGPGGGGGGGMRQPAPPPKALREGPRQLSSPLPVRRPPPPIAPAPEPPPPAPLRSEPLPVLVAPIIAAPADNRDRLGDLRRSNAELESRGPGRGGGVGAGEGTGIGPGEGAGVSPGSGGGTGGGPFRPGSGIEPPRLLREVKPDYSDEARRRSVEGDVLLEIVVRRDGTVGDVKTLRRLGAGLDERAAQAVRQWRFAPATRLGAPVDVIVEVVVEFKLR